MGAEEEKNMRRGLSIIGLALGLTGVAWGHLDSLEFDGAVAVRKIQPAGPWITVGGQTFSFGQQVTITWDVLIAHLATTLIFVQYSNDGGTNWSNLTSVASPPVGKKTYLWTVPSTATAQAKIRLQQDFQPASATSNDYNLVSGAFTVQAAAPISTFEKPKNFSLRQSGDLLFLNLGGFASENAKAEICNLNGSVMRAFNISAGTNPAVLPTASLPMGQAIFRLRVEGEPVQNQVVMLRR